MAAGAVLQALIVGLQSFLIPLGHKGDIAFSFVLGCCGLVGLLRGRDLDLQSDVQIC